MGGEILARDAAPLATVALLGHSSSATTGSRSGTTQCQVSCAEPRLYIENSPLRDYLIPQSRIRK